MNNKGVITRGMAILTLLILVVIIIIFVSINIGKKSNINKYKDFENELVIGAQNYYEIKNIDIDEGEEEKISLNDLKNSNLIYSDLKDKCEGYVIITNEENLSSEKYELVYNAYIKCGKKYITANYSEY